MSEFYLKYWKSEEILSSFYINFFSDVLGEVLLLNRLLYLLNETLKKYWKWKASKYCDLSVLRFITSIC